MPEWSDYINESVSSINWSVCSRFVHNYIFTRSASVHADVEGRNEPKKRSEPQKQKRKNNESRAQLANSSKAGVLNLFNFVAHGGFWKYSVAHFSKFCLNGYNGMAHL